MIGHRLRRAAIAGLVLLPLLAVTGRVFVAGRSDLAIADEAARTGLIETATSYYGKAARGFLPFVGSHERARDALEALAARLEMEGRPAKALECLRKVRGAVLGTRWLGGTDDARLARVNEGIARLTELGPASNGGTVLSAAAHAELLARDASPSPIRSAAAILVFIGWLAVTAAGAWRFVTPDGAIRGRQVLVWLPASLVLLGLWLVLLRFA